MVDESSRESTVCTSPDVVEGHSFSRLVRVCGLICFLLINPLFLWIWVDDPKFVEGPIDFPEIFMGTVTVAVEILGVFGLMTVFAKTRVTAEAIEWGLYRRRELALDQIGRVLSIFTFRMTTIMQLVDKDGRRHEITAGTPELLQAFQKIQVGRSALWPPSYSIPPTAPATMASRFPPDRSPTE